MNPEPFWLNTSPAFNGATQLTSSTQVDVAIVGGGLTGLSAALTLAKKGTRVCVLEAGRIVSEASGRNGGHCNNGLSHDFSSIATRFGLERAREMYRAFDAGVDLVEAIVKREGIDCDFTRSGKLKLAAKPAHFEKMVRAQEVLSREVDSDTAIIHRKELAAEIKTDRYFGGLLQRRSASLHVGRYGVGLANAAVRAGASIHQNDAVMSIERIAGGKFILKTATGTITADQVFLATGANPGGPFGWFRRRIVPIGSFIIVTEPLGSAVAGEVMPGRRNYTTSQHIGHYFRLTAENRLVFGGRARFAMSDAKSDLKSGAILQRHLSEIFPQLAKTKIDHCWGGLVDMTQDRLPRAGTHEGMHFSMGYSGHGVQMSTYMGDVMARRILGDDAVNPWRSIDWPAVPGHLGRPWFLPFVGLYYRGLDRIS